MPKSLIVITAIILLLLGAALMYAIEAASGLTFTRTQNLTPAEFITIVLSALGVILAAMTLMIGALAIIGWNSIQSRVERKVDESSEDYLKRRFSDDDEEYQQFVEDIKEDVRVRLLAFTRQFQREIDEEDEREQGDPDA